MSVFRPHCRDSRRKEDMSRVKITEYRAKKLVEGEEYRGVHVRESEYPPFPKKGRFVAKVDEGVKKRLKQGLVALDLKPREVQKTLVRWRKRGFREFLVEPFLSHRPEEEQYLSLERVRTGIKIMHAKQGGVDIEEHPEAVKTFVVTTEADIPGVARLTKLPETFLRRVVAVFEKNFFAFLEINPLVVRGAKAYPLDAAVLVDSAGAFFIRGAWNERDILRKAQRPVEKRIIQLAETTPASLRLTVFNPNGAIFFLLSGGGGSIVIADETALQGAGSLIGNYGEYSGGPTRAETYLYAREVLHLLLASRAKKKALVIAGGIANFTDIEETLTGVIDALSEVAELLRKAKVQVFVRRGGPNEARGLAHIREFLKQEKLLGSVYGSDEVITKAAKDAIRFVRP